MSNQKEFYENVTFTDSNELLVSGGTSTGVVSIKNQEEFFRLISVTDNKINIKKA
jgi:hypothetical protein